VGEEGGLSEGGTCSSGYVQELLQQQRRQQQQQQEAGRPSSSSGGSSNNPYSSSCADSVAQGPVGCGEMHVLQEQQQGGHFSRKRGCGEDAPKALQQQQQQQQQQSSQSGPWLEQRTGPDGIAITFIVMGSDPEGPTLETREHTPTHNTRKPPVLSCLPHLPAWLLQISPLPRLCEAHLLPAVSVQPKGGTGLLHHLGGVKAPIVRLHHHHCQKNLPTQQPRCPPQQLDHLFLLMMVTCRHRAAAACTQQLTHSRATCHRVECVLTQPARQH